MWHSSLCYTWLVESEEPKPEESQVSSEASNVSSRSQDGCLLSCWALVLIPLLLWSSQCNELYTEVTEADGCEYDYIRPMAPGNTVI